MKAITELETKIVEALNGQYLINANDILKKITGDFFDVVNYRMTEEFSEITLSNGAIHVIVEYTSTGIMSNTTVHKTKELK